jgi:hypothetical protein
LKQETGISVEMNDYDVTSLHIPYGPGWDSRRIDKLVYQTVRDTFAQTIFFFSKSLLRIWE